MNSEALQIINALNTRMDSLRTELAGDINESRRELLENLSALETRLIERIQEDQKDHSAIKRALIGLGIMVFVSLGANGGPKLVALLESLL